MTSVEYGAANEIFEEDLLVARNDIYLPTRPTAAQNAPVATLAILNAIIAFTSIASTKRLELPVR